MFERQIEAYEMLRKEYMQRVTSRMNRDDLKEYNEVLIAYKHPDTQAGEYTDTDIAAGDTLFGDHEQLIARVPQLLQSTQSALFPKKLKVHTLMRYPVSCAFPLPTNIRKKLMLSFL